MVAASFLVGAVMAGMGLQSVLPAPLAPVAYAAQAGGELDDVTKFVNSVQASYGENQEILGEYDEENAAVCRTYLAKPTTLILPDRIRIRTFL